MDWSRQQLPEPDLTSSSVQVQKKEACWGALTPSKLTILCGSSISPCSWLSAVPLMNENIKTANWSKSWW